MTCEHMTHAKFFDFLEAKQLEQKRVVFETIHEQCFHYALTHENFNLFHVYIHSIELSTTYTSEFESIRDAYAFYVNQFVLDCLSDYTQNDEKYDNDEIFIVAVASDLIKDNEEHLTQKCFKNRVANTLKHEREAKTPNIRFIETLESFANVTNESDES